MGDRDDKKDQPPAPPAVETVAFSNAVRLSGREWIIVAIITIPLILFAPALWKRYEPFTPGPDYRMPHDLSDDYWLYERYAALAAARYDTLLIGDSVIWGEYVMGNETLSHYLNEQAGASRCANLGLDGAHPLSLSGLVDHYATGVAGKNVVLLCNPLWMSSPEADLQSEKSKLNHSRLVPQFVPQIPSYKDQISPRIGVKVEQHVPFNSWTNHLQQTYYNRSDIPSWTLEHPYDNPIKPLARALPPPDNARRHPLLPWYKNEIAMQDYPWIDLDTSLQWHAFQEVVKTLRERGNRVFVVVGPFNEHLLTAGSRQRYQKVKVTIATWLETQQVAHLVPDALPSDQYGDASHPLPKGYAALARQLWDEPSFQTLEKPR